MTPLPKMPTGPDPLVQSLRQIIQCVRERTIIADPSVEVSRTTQGTRIKVKNTGAGKSTGVREPARWA